jgi:ATP-dependent RNA helicase RhlB
MDFHSLPIPAPVLQGIDTLGFTRCTPIQESALPVALKGKDVAGQAQTGTGKTATFLIVIFTRLLERARRPGPPTGQPRAFVVAPTRELAVQILHDAKALGQFTGLKMTAAFGGVDYEKQRQTLQGEVDLLVGTPGRLIDYFRQGVYSLKAVEVLVVDEADRLFDMGFIDDIRYLLRRLPPPAQRQSFLFSATLSQRVWELAYEFMNEPVQIVVTPEQVTAENVDQVLYHVSKEEKFSLLLGLLQREQPERTLIFVNMKVVGERVADRLAAHGYQVRAITGDVDQKVRLKIMEAFKGGRLPILVATDVASRGLHIEAVSHVINYDLPQDAEDYVHRIGRTARAGATGKAISLCDEEGAFYLEAIEKFAGQKVRVDWADDSLFLPDTGRVERGRAKRTSLAPAPAPPAAGAGGGAAGTGRRRRRRGGRDRRETGGQAPPAGPSRPVS